MIFRRSPKSAWSRKNSRSTIPAGCRASCSTCAATSSRTLGCAGPSIIAFDFEEMNKQLFYGQYKRINSYFDGTELASSGLPEGQELQFLETVRDKVPPEVFTTPYKIRSAAIRKPCAPICARAAASEGSRLRDHATASWWMPPASRSPSRFWCRIPPASGIALFYKPSLERIGVTTSIRIVDDAQYQNRLRSFDFDIIIDVWPESLSPGNEQREFWGSQTADQPGSRNTIGIKNPAVDALIDKVIFAKDRAGLVAAPRRSIACCCGISTSCRNSPMASRAMRAGTASAMPSRCRNMAIPVCRRCGGSMPTRPPGSASDLEGFSAHGAALPPACARSRRRCAERGAVAASERRPMPGAEAHGISVFGDLKYPADFHHFDYVNLAGAEGRACFR